MSDAAIFLLFIDLGVIACASLVIMMFVIKLYFKK